MLQQNGIHVVSLEELLAKSKGGKKPARLPVKCRTWVSWFLSMWFFRLLPLLLTWHLEGT